MYLTVFSFLVLKKQTTILCTILLIFAQQRNKHNARIKKRNVLRKKYLANHLLKKLIQHDETVVWKPYLLVRKFYVR